MDKFNEWLGKYENGRGYPETYEDLKLFAEAVVIAHRNYQFENNRMHCAFCYKVLDSEDHQGMAPDHYHHTCKEHHKFAHFYQVSLVQLREGLPTQDPTFKGFFDE